MGGDDSLGDIYFDHRSGRANKRLSSCTDWVIRNIQAELAVLLLIDLDATLPLVNLA